MHGNPRNLRQRAMRMRNLNHFLVVTPLFLTRAGLKLVPLQSLQTDAGDLQEYGLLMLLIERPAAHEPRLVPVQANQA